MIIKKKIRDITKEEFEIWQNTNCKIYGLYCTGCPFKMVQCRDTRNEIPWYKNKEMFSDKFLNQEIDIEVPSILDGAEKRYLSNIIKPFRNRVESITKTKYDVIGRELRYEKAFCIEIAVNPLPTIACSGDLIRLPMFTNTKMYVNMEEDKKYTLEELGL